MPSGGEDDRVTTQLEGAPLEHSGDVFLPRSLDLHVMRWLEERGIVRASGPSDSSCRFSLIARRVSSSRPSGPITTSERYSFMTMSRVTGSRAGI